jgi:hypothetical protein
VRKSNLKEVPREMRSLDAHVDDMDLDSSNYPEGVDLHPSSETHSALLQMILQCAKDAMPVLDGVKPEWKKIDYSMTAFVPLDEQEARDKAKDWRDPVNLVIPASYASRETHLTYLWSAFIRDPIHRYKGHGQDRVSAMLLEQVVQKQTALFQHALAMDAWMKDGLTYGIGAMHVGWAKHRVEHTIKTEVTEVIQEALKGTGNTAKIGEIIRHLEERVAYEGSKLTPIDPYRLLLDPGVTPETFQDGEFIGWLEETTLARLKRDESDPEMRLFNIDAVRKIHHGGGAKSQFWNEDTGRNTRNMTEMAGEGMDQRVKHPVHLIKVFVDLIPEEWDLSDRTRPQKWAFTVAGDKIIIQAGPLDLDHGRYPVVINAPNADGHSVVPVSHMATTYGIQQAIDRLLVSHIINTIRGANIELLFDPKSVYMDDLKAGSGPRLIRIKRNAFNGEPLSNYVQQLQVANVTQGNIASASVLMDILKSGQGTTDITMGDMSGMPERPTSQGLGMAQNASLSRLQRIAQKIGIQGMGPLAYQLAYNTTQFMDESVFVDMGGRNEKQLRLAYGSLDGVPDEIEVSPGDLNPYFDVEPHDGTLPDKENTMAWTEIMKTLLATPGAAEEIAQRSDIFKVFMHWAKLAGANDLNEFVREGGGNFQPQVVPDGPGSAFQQQVQAGNLVPVQGLGQ